MNHLPSWVWYLHRHVFDEGRGLAGLRGFAPALLVFERAHVARADVFAHHELVAHEVLEDDADAPAEHGRVPFLQVAAIEQHASMRGFVQACQELDQRGLARAVLADQRQALAALDLQVHARDRDLVGAGIPELHVFELHAGVRIGTADRGAAALIDRLLEVFIQRRQVQVVLVHAADGAETGRDRGLTLAEQHDVHRHLAERDERRAPLRPRTRHRRCRATRYSPA